MLSMSYFFVLFYEEQMSFVTFFCLIMSFQLSLGLDLYLNSMRMFCTGYYSLMYEPFFMTFTDLFFWTVSVFSSETLVISCDSSALFSFLLRLDFLDFLDILDIFSNAFEAADKVPKNKDKLR